MSYERKYKRMTNEEKYEPKETVKDVSKYPFADVPERGIRKETMKKFGVRVGYDETDGSTLKYIYFPSYSQKGRLLGYKRQDLSLPKEHKGHWKAIGNVSIGNKLFGQSVAEEIGRKRNNLTVTEGEWDCLSCFQSMVDSVAGTKYEGLEPFIVSIPLGTANAVESLLHNEQFAKSFDGLTLFFDDDSCTPAELSKGIMKGHEARNAVAGAFLGTSLKIFTIQPEAGLKDASDYLQADRSSDLAKLVQFERKPYVAEKIVHTSDIPLEEILAPRAEGVYVTQFPKLMEKIHGLRPSELTILTSPSGVGKCHGKGSKVLMHDMSEKFVEDVVVGDLLMGDDGSPRKVLNLHRGVDMIYNISSVKGTTNYSVNSKHLLSLKSNTNCAKRGFIKGGVVNISVLDYLSLPKHYKEHSLCGYKADLKLLGEEAQFEEVRKDEAYMLGLWLAEGSSKKSQVTLCKEDVELIEQVDSFISKNGLRKNVSPSNNRKGSIAIDLSGGYHTYLKDIGVFGNKHIPQKFMVASYADRLSLIAGFVDGDGYKTNNCIELCLKDNQLAKDIAKIVSSVGLSVKVTDKFSKCQNFDGEIYKRIIISGDTCKIPNRLSRKKCSNRKQVKDALRSGLIVKEAGVGEYFGFEVDGNNLYCMSDFSVTHNSTTTAIFAQTLLDAGETVGMIFLEENRTETVQRFIAARLKVNYLQFKNDPIKCVEKQGMTREDIVRVKQEIDASDNLVLLDHFGSMPIDELMNKIRHLHFVDGCRFIFLDHISLCVSGSRVADERKELDIVLTELAAFCASNDCSVIAVSHINRSGSEQFRPPRGEEDKAFWVRVSKSELRGSGGLEQLAFTILGLEPEINPDRSRGRVRWCVLKNRPWSYLGEGDTFAIDDNTWEVVCSNIEGF